VISDYEEYRREQIVEHGYPFIVAKPRERYSVRIYNPMPVRVAVNLSIDGLNSITGRPCTPASGKKWLIEPYSHIVITGWQVSEETSRRFYFTSKQKSYAAWQSNPWGHDLTVNCGMISAAYFWGRRDIERYFERHPIYEEPPIADEDAQTTMRAPRAKSEARANDQEAGTGMGEREHHPVHSVDFKYNMGMYNGRTAVKIYYDFAPYYPYRQKHVVPDDPEFAPEVPNDDDED
jgi:hypothetical protein